MIVAALMMAAALTVMPFTGKAQKMQAPQDRPENAQNDFRPEQRKPSQCDAKAPNGEWREKMRAEKIAFLTAEMDLTPEEAQAFWPVYNRAEAEKKAAFESMFRKLKTLKEALDAGKPDRVVSELLEDYVEACNESGEIDEDYLEKYETVIPASKVAKLYLGEEKFRRQQIKSLHGGPQQAKGGAPKPGMRPQGDAQGR